MIVAYHESCHLAHGQKVTQQPRQLLQLLPGVKLVELKESSWCCGSAGIYSITQPEQSAALLDRKLKHLQASGAAVLATSNPGCHLQIESGLKAISSPIEVIQPVTLLARSYRQETSPSISP
jgi:glycolate oxidase iron-sulfur subunit